MRCVLWFSSLVILMGCTGPRDKNLLPDEGPTTLQVYEQHLGGEIAGQANPAAMTVPATPFVGPALLPGQHAPSRRTQQRLSDLQRDFQQVPNPDLLGYVYPHLRGNLPVPGYFTTFQLYDQNHVARPGEGIVVPR